VTRKEPTYTGKSMMMTSRVSSGSLWLLLLSLLSVYGRPVVRNIQSTHGTSIRPSSAALGRRLLADKRTNHAAFLSIALLSTEHIFLVRRLQNLIDYSRSMRPIPGCRSCKSLSRVARPPPDKQTSVIVPVCRSYLTPPPPYPYSVDFYSDSCGPCRQMAPIFKKVAGQYKDKVRGGITYLGGRRWHPCKTMLNALVLSRFLYPHHQLV
jgi:thiol-disulfide isomerase/thioredoxin